MSDLACSSTPTRPLCLICTQKYAIYTCPRCSAKTCSLPCSTLHKSHASCSGERDKAAFVPMNTYGWGTMMDDYVFLEDVGRKVGDWGKEIVKGGFATAPPPPSRGAAPSRARGRGRGRGGATGGSAPKTKRDILKIQLDAIDIDMDLLPIGMQRRKQNQSYWDYKTNTAYLTVEFRFHPPFNPLNPTPKQPAFSLLTHRNSLTLPLLTLMQTHLSTSKSSSFPEWVKTLAMPHADDPEGFVVPQCLLSAHAPTRQKTHLGLNSTATPAFYSLDTGRPLSEVLRHAHFVEFPSIDVWEKDAEDNQRIVVVEAKPECFGWPTRKRPASAPDAEGGNSRMTGGGEGKEEEEAWNGTTADGWTGVYQPKPKRRKVDLKAGKKAIVGLLGDYGSDEDEDGDKGKANTKQKGGALVGLGGYAGSSDDEDTEPANITMEMEPDPDYDEDEEDTPLDPAALLELMKQATDGQWAGDEDAVDWGDSDREL